MAVILVVDDDSSITDVCTIVLESKGHLVLSAHYREDGMRLALEQDPDLILLDVKMEREDDGVLMAYELRSEGFNAPIVMLSNFCRVARQCFKDSVEKVPVDCLLEKPVQPGDLVKAVEHALLKPKGNRKQKQYTEK